MSFSEAHIGRHQVSHAHMNEIARDQFLGRHRLPLAAVPHPRLYRQPLAKQGKSIVSALLLYQAQTGVKDKKKADDDSFGTLAQNRFQCNCGLEHPRDWRPELLSNRKEEMGLRLANGILDRTAPTVHWLPRG